MVVKAAKSIMAERLMPVLILMPVLMLMSLPKIVAIRDLKIKNLAHYI